MGIVLGKKEGENFLCISMLSIIDWILYAMKKTEAM